MDPADISAIAHHLFETEGVRAIAVAAQKAVAFEGKRDAEQAKMWRQVEAVLREMRGSNQS